MDAAVRVIWFLCILFKAITLVTILFINFLLLLLGESISQCQHLKNRLAAPLYLVLQERLPLQSYPMYCGSLEGPEPPR